MGERRAPRPTRRSGGRASRDHGLTVGDGVFEAIKVVDGRPFALTRHLARLARSRRRPGAAGARPGRRTPRRRGRARRRSTCRSGRIRITYTGGVAPLGSRPRRRARRRWSSSPTRWSPCAPTTAVVTVPWPRNERGALAGLKTTSYAENVVALAYAAASAARARRSSPTSPATCARAPGPTSSTSSTASCARPTLGSGCLAGVTRALSSSGTAAARSTSRSRCSTEAERGLPGRRRPATCRPCTRWDDRELVAGPVTGGCRRSGRRGRPRTSTRDPSVPVRHAADPAFEVTGRRQEDAAR